jgi:UDP-N-acetylmuramoyl-tripeptide--D-alanyl-D-alanine ligase
LDFKTLAKEVKGALADHRFGTVLFEGVSIDSRAVQPGDLFIAIRGEKDDGHKYINDVMTKAAAGLLVCADYADLVKIQERIPVVSVPDTHEAMITLAQGYRRRLKGRFVAITGSNGKTTTKEFVYAMISLVEEKTYRSPGNLNNLFGLPLAIFAMPIETKYGIFELGISVPGEMTRLAKMIIPDLILITNVGPTHLETLGTVENVAEAKLELVDAAGSDVPVILNNDFPILMQAARKRNRKFITYGIDTPADFTARRIGISDDGFPMIEIDGAIIKARLFGEHQAYNILAGYATCQVLGLNIKPEQLNDIDYRFAPYRGEIENINGLTIIADCYNANPASLRSGLLSFRNYLDSPTMKGKGNIAVIGDMLELGEKSDEYHREIGTLAGQLKFDRIIAVGPMSQEICNAAIKAGMANKSVLHFLEVEKAGEFLINIIKRGDVIYLKASRGIGLEKIITLLKGSAFRQN